MKVSGANKEELVERLEMRDRENRGQTILPFIIKVPPDPNKPAITRPLSTGGRASTSISTPTKRRAPDENNDDEFDTPSKKIARRRSRGRCSIKEASKADISALNESPKVEHERAQKVSEIKHGGNISNKEDKNLIEKFRSKTGQTHQITNPTEGAAHHHLAASKSPTKIIAVSHITQSNQSFNHKDELGDKEMAHSAAFYSYKVYYTQKCHTVTNYC